MPLSEPTFAQPIGKLVARPRATNRRVEPLALDVIDLLRGLEAFGKASRPLAGLPKREQRQEHGEIALHSDLRSP